MIIKYTKRFQKQFENLRKNERIRVEKALRTFRENPYDSILRNHKLHGLMRRKRAISAGGDIRLVFTEEEGYVNVIFLSVGSHSEVY